ncbi:MAG: glycoside hydrolase family 6 protein [Cyanobacteria bacterium]|nr:glycoside hydrolase family 6 protein [Cyanobacteriota bacterium]
MLKVRIGLVSCLIFALVFSTSWLWVEARPFQDKTQVQTIEKTDIQPITSPKKKVKRLPERTAIVRPENDSLLRPLFKPVWTSSYERTQQPHAIWLDQFAAVGVNHSRLKQVLLAAEAQQAIPAVVIYCIPQRDMGQASAGGFASEADYLAENKLLADEIARFVKKNNISPEIYLEPDSLGHALGLAKKGNPGLLNQRTSLLQKVSQLYSAAGARVYLDAAHSGWFDYSDEDILSLANALKQSGVEKVTGIVSNISNRQALGSNNPKETSVPQTEARFIQRLLLALPSPRRFASKNTAYEVVIDTSRCGNPTSPPHFLPRQFWLAPDGRLFDNQSGLDKQILYRFVGQWEGNLQKPETLKVKPLLGDPLTVGDLLTYQQYQWDGQRHLLTAPIWLDPIGDVQTGPVPNNHTGYESVGITKFRFIKPPDESDGALNYRPGESKAKIDIQLNALQIVPGGIDPLFRNSERPW